MPRKVKSSGVATGEQKTSLRRAAGAPDGRRASMRRSATEIQDGGKWAGSGRKVAEHSEGPEIARQKQTGRGAKTRTAFRADKANHPSHG
jgi:hypothetical protein